MQKSQKNGMTGCMVTGAWSDEEFIRAFPRRHLKSLGLYRTHVFHWDFPMKPLNPLGIETGHALAQIVDTYGSYTHEST